MTKFVYVGDPTINPKTGHPQGPCAVGRTTIRVGHEEVTLIAGEPIEVSDAVAARLKNSNHFALVEEKAVKAAKVESESGEGDEPSDEHAESRATKRAAKQK